MIQVALFGAGRIGRIHAGNLVRQPGVRLKYVVDVHAGAAAEVAAFVDRPAPSAIEATRPAARSSSNSYSGSNRNTPLAEAAGIYSSGQR